MTQHPDDAPALQDQESFYSFDEFFISRTDKHGVICNGNDVFVRVSQYSSDELIGSPHNRIRHPDMPKAVFRIFWQLLEANKTAAAFVKNRAKSGAYYWVIATVFPIEDGYFSIRFKPQSEIWKKTVNLYQATLDLEKNEGMDAALKFISGELISLGFDSYEEFMVEALKAELLCRDSRDKSLAGQQNPDSVDESAMAKLFAEMIANLTVAKSRLKATTKIIRGLPSGNRLFGKDGGSIAETCNSLRALSVNMSLSSHKLGKSGGALSVVANAFQKTTEQILASHQKVDAMSVRFKKQLNESVLGLLTIRVLVEMLSFDFNSTHGKLGKKEGGVDLAGTMVELKRLFVATQGIYKRSLSGVNQFTRELAALRKEAELLRNYVVRLEFIRTGGWLEASRTSEVAGHFAPFLKAMESDLANLLGRTTEMTADLSQLLGGFSTMAREINSLEIGLEECARTIESILELNRARGKNTPSAMDGVAA